MRSRTALRSANWLLLVLFVLVIGLLMWLSRSYHTQFDWTAGARRSLSTASVETLKKLAQPVKITAFASTRQGTRPPIQELVARYQRHKKDLTLEFVDPDRDLARVREAHVRFDGEVIVEYAGRKETLAQLNEDTLTNALLRLSRSGEQWIVFLSGHGERSIERQANHDYSIWSQQLAKRGLKTRALVLGQNATIPTNTAVLVIADPRVRLLAGEVKQIQKYVGGGGNLLWLQEPDGLDDLDPLAEALGLEFERGTIIDPNARQLVGGDPTYVLVGAYGPHPIVQNLAMTIFPTAGPLKAAAKNFEAQNFLETSSATWAETGKLQGEVAFDAGKDLKGPLTLGIALTRTLEKRQQRVAVIHDADFIANSFVGLVGNLDLGMNLVNWLASDNDVVNIPMRTAPDTQLALTPMAQNVIGLGFLIALPLFLLGTGIVVWWRRRRR